MSTPRKTREVWLRSSAALLLVGVGFCCWFLLDIFPRFQKRVEGEEVLPLATNVVLGLYWVAAIPAGLCLVSAIVLLFHRPGTPNLSIWVGLCLISAGLLIAAFGFSAVGFIAPLLYTK